MCTNAKDLTTWEEIYNKLVLKPDLANLLYFYDSLSKEEQKNAFPVIMSMIKQEKKSSC